jgi:hypothetical protein
MDEPTDEPRVVEIRCPLGPRNLFTKLRLGQEIGRHLSAGNLIEVTCNWCERRLMREDGTAVRVFHRFNFLGELVETVTEPRLNAANGAGHAPSD